MVFATFKTVSFAASLLAVTNSVQAQVTATFPNGVTNPDRPEIAQPGSVINQTSDSRLLTINSVDDFCIFGPPEPGPDSLIGNVEPIVVAYCTKPRNGARLIPDGTIHSAHFVKTEAYVQINGFWDGTKVNIPYGDSGGELDPHGAENVGNPIGGNVTSNVNGQDVFYEEWMSFVSYDQFCIRVCTSNLPGNPNPSLMCEHELDVMGCAFVMPSVNMYNNNTFTSCEADVGEAPGLYPLANGSTSTFRQRYTGSYTDQGTVAYWTVGQEVTPSGPATTPAVSMCTTYPTISNGINTADFVVVAQQALVSGTAAVSASTTAASSSTGSMTSSGSTARMTGSSGTGAASTRATTGAGASTAAAAASSSAAGGATGKVEFFGGMGGLLIAGAAAIGGGLLVLA